MQFFCLLQPTSPVKRDSYSHPINRHEPVKHAETRIMISTSIYCTQLSLWNYTSTCMAESNNDILELVVYVLRNSGTAIGSSITIQHAIRFAWRRHQMETFPRYCPFVQGIHRSPVKCETPSRSLWRQCNGLNTTMCPWQGNHTDTER